MALVVSGFRLGYLHQLRTTCHDSLFQSMSNVVQGLSVCLILTTDEDINSSSFLLGGTVPSWGRDYATNLNRGSRMPQHRFFLDVPVKLKGSRV